MKQQIHLFESEQIHDLRNQINSFIEKLDSWQHFKTDFFYSNGKFICAITYQKIM